MARAARTSLAAERQGANESKELIHHEYLPSQKKDWGD
jgi:hypothetical protein